MDNELWQQLDNYDQPNNRHNDKAENADHLILGHDRDYVYS